MKKYTYNNYEDYCKAIERMQCYEKATEEEIANSESRIEYEICFDANSPIEVKVEVDKA